MAEMIVSAQNPFAQRLKKLNDRKYRDEEKLLLAEGPKICGEALKEGLLPRAALISDKWADGLGELQGALEKAGCDVRICSEQVLKSVSDTRTPQGIACAFTFPRPMDISAAPRLIAALDGVQDPGNVGGIWRTADAAGFGGVLFSDGCADPMSPKVIRSAMGSAFRVPALSTDTFAEDLKALRGKGYRIIVTALDGADFYEAMPGRDEKCVLVIGSEGHGIRPETRAAATDVLRLPMKGGAESLNANVAAGIMLYSLSFGLRAGDI